MKKMQSTWKGVRIYFILLCATIARSSDLYNGFDTNSHILSLPEFRLKQRRTEAMNMKDSIQDMGKCLFWLFWIVTIYISRLGKYRLHTYNVKYTFREAPTDTGNAFSFGSWTGRNLKIYKATEADWAYKWV